MRVEAHVTIDPSLNAKFSKAQIKEFVQDCGWKFSAIEGDPDLGDKIFYYATKSWPFIEEVTQMGCLKILQQDMFQYGLISSREKLEIILYDHRIE